MPGMTDKMDARSPAYDAGDDDLRATREDEHRKPEADRADEAKMRACLVCRKPFLSAWAGERICRQCKSTSAWRGGVL